MSALFARVAATGILAMALAGAVGCASKPPPPKPPTKTVITVTAQPDVNPDASGRPSPVVIRLYRLNSDVAFRGSDFFALFDDDKKVLAAELLAREEYELAPGESKTEELVLPPEVRFIAVLAAFRDIRNSTWRAIVPAPAGPAPKRRQAKPIHIGITAEKQMVRIELGP